MKFIVPKQRKGNQYYISEMHITSVEMGHYILVRSVLKCNLAHKEEGIIVRIFTQ